MEMWIYVVIAAVLAGVVVVPLWRLVRQDGLGHRPPPASHVPWFDRSEGLT